MVEAPLTNRRSSANSSWPTPALAFLGGGHITSALIAGLRLARYSPTIVVHDRHLEKLRALRREFKVETVGDLKSCVERAEILILAVRPGSVPELRDAIAGSGPMRLPSIAV